VEANQGWRIRQQQVKHGLLLSCWLLQHELHGAACPLLPLLLLFKNK
jgi:hypothetical protein